MTNQRKQPSEWVFPFLDALRNMPIVSYACKEADISRSVAYQYRKKSKKFAEEWDDALEEGIDHLEQKVWQAAQKGDRELMMFLLKALRPAKYRENRHATSSDEPIEIVLTQVPARKDAGKE